MLKSNSAVDCSRNQETEVIVKPPGTSSSILETKIGGVDTEFAIFDYSDRVFVTVTQFGCIGNLYLAERDQQKGITTVKTFEVRCLLGGEDQEVTVAVRNLAEKLQLPKPLLVSLTLPTVSPQDLTAIAEVITTTLKEQQKI